MHPAGRTATRILYSRPLGLFQPPWFCLWNMLHRHFRSAAGDR